MKRRFALSALAIAGLLTGCLDNMEKTTSDTKDAVLRSVDVIDDTHHDQKLGGALNLLPEDIAMMSAGAETMFIMAADNRIYKYLGCTRPLKYPMGMDSSKPNVAYVGTAPDAVKNLAPISPAKYEILELATMRVLRELVDESQKQLTKTELADIKSKAKRMFYVSTALLGAQIGPTRNREEEDQVRAVLRNQEKLQTEAAEKLRGLAVLFVDPGDDLDMKFKVERLIEARFNNNFENINPAGTL